MQRVSACCSYLEFAERNPIRMQRHASEASASAAHIPYLIYRWAKQLFFFTRESIRCTSLARSRYEYTMYPVSPVLGYKNTCWWGGGGGSLVLTVVTLRRRPGCSVVGRCGLALHSQGRRANGHLCRDRRRARADRRLCNQCDTSAHVGDRLPLENNRASHSTTRPLECGLLISLQNQQ